MEVEILLYKKSDDELGINSDMNIYAPFYFSDSQLAGFWIDPEVDSGTKVKEIVFYVGSGSFRTPYKKALAEEFYEIIKEKQS